MILVGFKQKYDVMNFHFITKPRHTNSRTFFYDCHHALNLAVLRVA
jgi:hypothetical protein